MRPAFVFDVDGTIVDSKELTISCYRGACAQYNRAHPGEAPVSFLDEYWGMSAAEWGCPDEVHAFKLELFRDRVDQLCKGWAWPILREALLRGEHVELLTGASYATLAILMTGHVLRQLPSASVTITTGMSAAGKREHLKALSQDRLVHYFDDLRVVDTVDLPNVQEHYPEAMLSYVALPTAAVVLAAGRGERFRMVGEQVAKPLLQFKGRALVDYALGSAKEINRRPILVAVPDVAEMPRPQVDTVPVLVTQRGPVESAELAGGYIRPSQPVVFLDSDVRISPGCVYEFVGTARDRNAACGALVAYRMDNPGRYGGVEADGSIVEGSETVTDCFVGVYFFKSWAYFKHCVAQARRDDLEEIKFTDLLRWQHVYIHNISPSDWTPLGTPEELNAAKD